MDILCYVPYNLDFHSKNEHFWENWSNYYKGLCHHDGNLYEINLWTIEGLIQFPKKNCSAFLIKQKCSENGPVVQILQKYGTTWSTEK